MNQSDARAIVVLLLTALLPLAAARAQPARPGEGVETWVSATDGAPGADLKAQDEATAAALRKAVEQTCGVFIKSQTDVENYTAIYDKVLSDTAGYVLKYEVERTWKAEGLTWVKVRALVSTRKFSEKWSSIAHTVNRANNPRVLIVIAEATNWILNEPTYDYDGVGTVQGKVEKLFLKHGLEVVDRASSEGLKSRDLILAEEKGDTKTIASVAARFHADVVVIGKATGRFNRTVELGGLTLNQYQATWNVKAIQADSARVLAAEKYGPELVTSSKNRAEDQALAKLAEESAPKFLEALVGAWRKRTQVRTTYPLSIKGMTFKEWSEFKAEVEKLRGTDALRLREITNDVAAIDIEYRYDAQNLAQRLVELKSVKLDVIEITGGQLKLKVLKPKE
jgi:nucleotide-binding universal stress UspA family protein